MHIPGPDPRHVGPRRCKCKRYFVINVLFSKDQLQFEILESLGSVEERLKGLMCWAGQIDNRIQILQKTVESDNPEVETGERARTTNQKFANIFYDNNPGQDT